jgi:hypothetical protein
MHQLLRLGRSGALFGALVVLARCGGSDIVLPNESRPSTITKYDGDAQIGRAGAPLPSPVVVKVVDQRGAAVAGQDVSFNPGEGSEGVQVTPQVATTDDEGLAKAEWVLGPLAGTQSIIAGLVDEDGLAVTFEATAQAGDPRRMQESGGNNQEARAGAPLSDPLVVLVTDELGNRESQSSGRLKAAPWIPQRRLPDPTERLPPLGRSVARPALSEPSAGSRGSTGRPSHLPPSLAPEVPLALYWSRVTTNRAVQVKSWLGLWWCASKMRLAMASRIGLSAGSSDREVAASVPRPAARMETVKRRCVGRSALIRYRTR